MKTKTIAEQLGVKEFPFIIKNSNGHRIYLEKSDGYWEKTNGNYYENSDGYWEKTVYDSNGKMYEVNSNGEWIDSNGNEVCYEDLSRIIGNFK